MIRIEIDDREVRRALEDLRRRASNMKPAMHTIGQALMEGSRERILSGRDWTGQTFAANSPTTLARKKGKPSPRTRGSTPFLGDASSIGTACPAYAGVRRHRKLTPWRHEELPPRTQGGNRWRRSTLRRILYAVWFAQCRRCWSQKRSRRSCGWGNRAGAQSALPGRWASRATRCDGI
jgi:hypothetical protein